MWQWNPIRVPCDITLFFASIPASVGPFLGIAQIPQKNLWLNLYWAVQPLRILTPFFIPISASTCPFVGITNFSMFCVLFHGDGARITQKFMRTCLLILETITYTQTIFSCLFPHLHKLSYESHKFFVSCVYYTWIWHPKNLNNFMMTPSFSWETIMYTNMKNWEIYVISKKWSVDV